MPFLKLEFPKDPLIYFTIHHNLHQIFVKPNLEYEPTNYLGLSSKVLVIFGYEDHIKHGSYQSRSICMHVNHYFYLVQGGVESKPRIVLIGSESVITDSIPY